MTAVLELTLSWLFKNAKGHDSKSFYTRPAFAKHPEQTITLTSPDCGATNGVLGPEYIHEGGGRLPELTWTTPPELQGKVAEWLLVSEDPDAPLPTPGAHALFGGIPASKTSVGPKDIEIEDQSKALLKGGFHYGANRRGVPYLAPRPLLNHGPHRYFYMIIALSEPLSPELLRSKATRDQLADAIDGKVLGWGMWVASAERVWK